MRIRYGRISNRLGVATKRLVMAAGLLVLPLTAKLEKSAWAKPVPPANVPIKPVQTDPRTTRLLQFFSRQHCPVLNLAEDFVRAADDNRLDWRLLPSISLVESGGGKAYRNNNIFGWNNGLEPFSSIRAGLNTVAFKLGKSPLYRNRDIVGKLRIYNPDETYAGKVVEVMNRISPKVELTPATSRVIRVSNEYVYAN